MAPSVRPSCFAVPGSSSSTESQVLPIPAPSVVPARSRGTGRRAAAAGSFRGGSATAAATGGGPVEQLAVKELEEKRKEKAKVAYDRKKQLSKLRVKAKKAADEKLGFQLDVLAPVTY